MMRWPAGFNQDGAIRVYHTPFVIADDTVIPLSMMSWRKDLVVARSAYYVAGGSSGP